MALVSEMHGSIAERRLPTSPIRVTWLCWIAMLAEGYDMSALGAVLPGMLRDPVWKLTPASASLLASAALFGMFFGGYGFGVIADRAGRKRAFLACISLFSLASICAALAPWPFLFGIARFFCGIGVGGIVPICSALVYEFSPPERANRHYALMYSGYTIGILLASLTAFALLQTHGWRVVIGLGALPLMFIPIATRFMPESMAFLSTQGRNKEAAAIARKFGLIVPACTSGGEIRPVAGIPALFAPGYRRATAGFWLATFGSMIVVYGLTTWLPQIMRSAGYELGPAILFLGVFALGSSFGGIVLGFIADHIGRTPTILGAFVVGAISIMALGYPWPLAMTYGVVAIAGVGTISAAVMVTSYLSSYFPAAIRATAVGSCLSFSRFGAVCGPMIGGAMATYRMPLAWNFMAYAGAALLAGVAILLPPHRRSGEVA